MSISREGYKKYLASLCKKDGSPHFKDDSIDSYCSRLSTAAEALELDVWALTDTSQIQQLITDWSPSGKHAEIGAIGNRTAYNALKRWADYVASTEQIHQVYSLLWAPERVLQSDGKESQELIAGAELSLPCKSQQPAVGDTVYLMQRELAPKGYIAKAIVTRASFDAPYWKDPKLSLKYIGIKLVEVRQTAVEGLLPVILIERFCDRHQPEFKQSLLQPGVAVPPAIANEINRVWSNSNDVHSLRQFIEWTQQDEVNSRPEWLQQYQSRLKEAEQLKITYKHIEDDELKWIWADTFNGICSVGQGALRSQEFKENLQLLRDITNLVRESPNSKSLQQVYQIWSVAKREKRLSRSLNLLIHRVFATFAPELYTTLVKIEDAKLVLKAIKDEFSIDVVLIDDWADQNGWILRSLQDAGVDMENFAANNVAIWQLYEALDARSKVKKSEAGELDAKEEENQMSQYETVQLNQIFFGPPGTGKTFITMEAAVRAAEPAFHWENRDQLKTKYRELTDAGRIVFVTFHQSYSYEDFVEGLTASSDSGQIKYTPKNGVFKKLVQKAKDNQHSGQQAISTSFERCWELFLQQLSDNADGVTITTRRSSFLITEVDDNTIRFDKSSGESVHSLSVSTLEAVFNQQRVIKGGLQPYYESLISHIKALGEQQSMAAVERQNFVLVIDEINRGNISRIFGELITLIEPSKRLGGSEPLEVVLPLTSEKFSVPDNLYIIGTMNTADRSLAGLDLALRRRFDFIEMPPKPDELSGVEIAGVNLEFMLSTINERISVLLDKDHCIGHASFMHLHPKYRPAEMPKTASLTELGSVFKHKVLPLLQEYFFEDWQRIVWVLNNQNKAADIAFIRKASGKPISELFKGVTQIKERERWEINQAAFTNAESYKLIYQDEAVTE